jgi:hypothetical protein
MSIYSRALNDSPLARLIFKLDQNEYTTIQGTQSSGLTVTQTGSTPTFSTQSCSGGTGSFIFDTTQGLYVANSDPIRKIGGDHTIEAVFRTTYSGATQKYIWRIPSGGYLTISNGDLTYQSANGSYNTTITATGSYNDNIWHHVVCRRWTEGSDSKVSIWIDGTKFAESTSFFGSFPSANHIYIGQNENSGNDDNWDGYIDFVATYGNGLTDQQIADRYAEFDAARFILNSVTVLADVSIASALIVDSISSSEVILTADIATASATFPEAQQSDLDPITSVFSYMTANAGLFEQYFRFGPNYKPANNLGTGGQPGVNYGGIVEHYPTGGLQFSGAIEITGSATDGTVSFGQPFMDPEINDGNYVLGYWVKFPNPNNEYSCVFAAYQQQGYGIRCDYDQGQLQFRIDNSNGSHVITSSGARKDDGNWHFVVHKAFNNTMELWIDNQLSATGTFAAQHPTGLTQFAFAGNNLGVKQNRYRIGHVFVGTTTNITAQILTNIYNSGISPNQFDAGATMTNAIPKFNSAYNDKVESLSPSFDWRLEEGPNANQIFDTVTLNALTLRGNTANRTSGVLAKNNRAVRFTNLDTFYQGTLTTPAGTFSSQNRQSISVLFKADPVGGFGDRLVSSGMEDSSGLSLLLNSSGAPIIGSYTFASGFQEVVGSGNYADGQWHHIVATKNGNTVIIYVDGKLNTTGTITAALTDTLRLAVGGIQWNAYSFLSSNSTRNTFIDEFAIFPTALNQQQVTELYQSIALTMDTTASAIFSEAAASAGTGVITTADPMTASAEKLYPQHFGPAMLAFATFVMPNYYAEIIINDEYYAEPLIASAVFHEPQSSIGENNVVASMDASAEIPMPTVFTPGRFTANLMVAGDAVFVNPGIVTVKGARHYAEPMRSNAIFPLPPAYIQLTDDKWFVRLLEGHADKTIEAVQTVGTGTNLANQATTDVVQGGFLTFFDDVISDITPITTINSISSEVPAYYFDKPGAYSYDSNGNLIAPNTSKAIARATASRGSSVTEPRLGVGYFDPYERKAVRIENIEFPLPGTTSQNSQRPYNIEFSIKTTKKDQVLAYGIKTSAYTYGRTVGAIGLSDGKIYLTEDTNVQFGITGGLSRGTVYPLSAPHPKKFINRAQYLLSKKDIADGQWHHIIIQQGFGAENLRTQIWIDGKLDRQIGAVTQDGGVALSSIAGSDGTNTIRPYILGFNSNDSLLYSDFETSAWNFYPGRFIPLQNIELNYIAYQQYEPVKAEPMLGTVTIGQGTYAEGNKSRMLLLYWWRNQVGYNQFVTSTRNPLTTGYDGNNSPFNPEDLIDDPKKGPKDWNGWDVFPMHVLGKDPSDIYKPGVQRTNAGFIDEDTGLVRLIDLQKDVDLSQFDMIMFANYPSTSAQLDEFIREEYIDSYFGVKEKDVYADFLKSLRAAVDNGLSLLVQFDQLARDLKIYDRVERIPIFNEGISDKRAFWHTPNVEWDVANNRPNAYESNNPASPLFLTLDEDKCKLDIDLENGAYFVDRYNNMRHRIINTVELLTDDPTYIWTDTAYYQHSDILDFGAPDRKYERYEYKIQGLQPGDEFIFGNPSNVTAFGNSRAKQTSILAVPFSNILAGKVITAQPEKYYKGAELVDNPYKNYAHSIALQPGDILDGKGIGGRIFVTVSEVFWDTTDEYRTVDLYTDYWIDIAYDLGFLGVKNAPGGEAEAERDRLKNTLENPAYVPTANKTIEHYNWLTYWSRNDNFAFTQVDRGQNLSGVLGLLFENSIEFERVPSSRKALQAFTRRRDQLGRFASGSGGNGSLFFQLKSGRTTDTMNVYVPGLITRGLWWLSQRERPTGLVNRPAVSTASATMPNALPVVDKIINVNAGAMIANAILPANVTGTSNPTQLGVSLTTLPLTASATIVELGKRVLAEPMTCTSLMEDPGIFTYSLEEVILTVHDTEAVVYLRRDKIT